MREVVADIADELADLEGYLVTALADEASPVQDVTTHLLQSGGKRLRPALVLLGGKFGMYDYARLRVLAAAAEMIHMATLVHDDVIDEAAVRRGRPTVNAQWDDWTSVLAGDYLFARAFELLASTGDARVVQGMARAVRIMCQGEIAQNVHSQRHDLPTEDAYLDRIGRKTAAFIAESLRCGALLSGATEEVADALYQYGYGIGISFQIVDDVLDLTANQMVLGKAIGSDLRAGVITLPVIHALRASPDSSRLQDLAAAQTVAAAEVEEVCTILGQAGSFGYAHSLADEFVQEAKSAIAGLKDIPTKAVLLRMADFVLERPM